MSETEPTPTTLYLIRHGATPSNEKRPYVLQGNGIDQSLSETGRAQAEAVGRFCAHLPFDAVYCSPLKRARETAAEIARHHDLEATPTESIHEVDVGRWEGLDWGTIMERHPGEYAAFIAKPGSTPYLEGESYADVFARSEPAIRAVLERHPGGHVAVIAHNVVNRAFLAPLLGLSIEQAKEIRQANTGVNVIEYSEESYKLVTLNAAFHLLTDFPAVR